jgi:hypothetical protein
MKRGMKIGCNKMVKSLKTLEIDSLLAIACFRAIGRLSSVYD